MVHNIITKSVGVFLIVAAHMVFIDCSRAQVKGILGSNITLQFTFNISITNDSHFAIYRNVLPDSQEKIAEYSHGQPKPGVHFNTYPRNGHVFYHIKNLSLSHGGPYWASFFMDSEGFPTESEKVLLIVLEEEKKSTVPTGTTEQDESLKKGGGNSSIMTSVLVVSPVVLLAAVLTGLIWCLVRTKDKQDTSTHQNSNPTIQVRAHLH
ncbi:uncharacterized protein LOC132966464 [Labrus mixtus]|uniref:uncharacterized protein LOC132966464 n=1 Tax=Labrus mixtus TaxID=508554 RepID=UPI0029C0BDD7|nr:uncharacterized protein LOC132966464 [Labrus mixtus]